MGRAGSEEFPKDKHYEEVVANATLAEKTKMDAIINWYEADNWEDALKLAKEKCNIAEITNGLLPGNRFKGKFVSENNGMYAIAKIAGLSSDEKNQLISEFYGKRSFSQNLRDKIVATFKDNPEEKLIKIIRNIHESWNIDQSDKFQMWNEKKGKARNCEHQFDDLLLMQFGEDGATADKVFVDTIFSELGIIIDENKLKDIFINQQKQFLDDIMKKYGDETKTPHQVLVTYLQSGKYLLDCGRIAGRPLTTHATAIKADPNRADDPEKWNALLKNEIPIEIEELTTDNKIADSMAKLIEEQIRANGIDFDNLLNPQISNDDNSSR